MANPGYPTLDQLRIFLAVVDAGSFNGAARKLNRAVSVISYGIANLEAQLGVTLLLREGSRRPILTDAGHAVLAEARSISVDVDGLRAKVGGLLAGLEPEVSLAVDVMIPARRVAALLRQFQMAYPTVSLRLHVEALGAIAALVLDGTASLGSAGRSSSTILRSNELRLGQSSLFRWPRQRIRSRSLLIPRPAWPASISNSC